MLLNRRIKARNHYSIQLSIIRAVDSMGLYGEGGFNPSKGYFYITIINNISVAYAFLVLANFYASLKFRLQPFHPMGKFLCIKFIVFFAFWQVEH